MAYIHFTFINFSLNYNYMSYGISYNTFIQVYKENSHGRTTKVGRRRRRRWRSPPFWSHDCCIYSRRRIWIELKLCEKVSQSQWSLPYRSIMLIPWSITIGTSMIDRSLLTLNNLWLLLEDLVGFLTLLLEYRSVLGCKLQNISYLKPKAEYSSSYVDP